VFSSLKAEKKVFTNLKQFRFVADFLFSQNIFRKDRFPAIHFV
jgi:hypothetical protein